MAPQSIFECMARLLNYLTSRDSGDALCILSGRVYDPVRPRRVRQRSLHRQLLCHRVAQRHVRHRLLVRLRDQHPVVLHRPPPLPGAALCGTVHTLCTARGCTQMRLSLSMLLMRERGNFIERDEMLPRVGNILETSEARVKTTSLPHSAVQR